MNKSTFFIFLLWFSQIAIPSNAFNPTMGGQNQLNHGLIAAYSFSEGSGATVIDKSGAGNNLTLTNTTWTSSGHTGNALTYDGLSSKAAKGNITAMLNLTNAVTFMGWFYPVSIPNDGQEHDGIAWSTGSNTPIALEPQECEDAGCPVDFLITTAGGWNNAESAAPIPANTWTHLAGTYDGTTVRLYVNGSLSASVSAPGPISNDVGELDIGSDSTWGDPFAGQIDDVRVFNRVLTPSEIVTQMNAPVAP